MKPKKKIIARERTLVSLLSLRHIRKILFLCMAQLSSVYGQQRLQILFGIWIERSNKSSKFSSLLECMYVPIAQPKRVDALRRQYIFHFIYSPAVKTKSYMTDCIQVIYMCQLKKYCLWCSSAHIPQNKALHERKWWERVKIRVKWHFIYKYLQFIYILR